MTSEEIVARGKELYENGIRAEVEPGNHGNYLAIDVETGEYLLATTHEDFVQKRFQLPHKRERYLMRIGAKGYYRRLGRRFSISKPVPIVDPADFAESVSR